MDIVNGFDKGLVLKSLTKLVSTSLLLSRDAQSLSETSIVVACYAIVMIDY